jgi:hypothetical protein
MNPIISSFGQRSKYLSSNYILYQFLLHYKQRNSIQMGNFMYDLSLLNAQTHSNNICNDVQKHL